jgi:hypothetical protein
MKTAVLFFEEGNLYIKDHQLSKILREENEPFGIRCRDYDDVDYIMPILKE